MAKKATRLLREAVWLARSGARARALALTAEAGEWAVRRRQVNLIAQAAQVWDALGGEPRVSARWRDLASVYRAARRSLPRW